MTASDSFVLTVNPVDDVPSFTEGANQTVALMSAPRRWPAGRRG